VSLSVLEAAIAVWHALNLTTVVPDEPLQFEFGKCSGGRISPEDHQRIAEANRGLFEALQRDWNALKEIA
jgi:hypothetical protein